MDDVTLALQQYLTNQATKERLLNTCTLFTCIDWFYGVPACPQYLTGQRDEAGGAPILPCRLFSSGEI